MKILTSFPDGWPFLLYRSNRITTVLQGGDPLKRNENDAAALQAKIAAKKAAKESGESQEPAKAPVVRKKVPTKKNESVDDLLAAGLTAGKKKSGKAK